MRRNKLIKHGVLKKVIIFAMVFMVVSSPEVYSGSIMKTHATTVEDFSTDENTSGSDNNVTTLSDTGNEKNEESNNETLVSVAETAKDKAESAATAAEKLAEKTENLAATSQTVVTDADGNATTTSDINVTVTVTEKDENGNDVETIKEVSVAETESAVKDANVATDNSNKEGYLEAATTIQNSADGVNSATSNINTALEVASKAEEEAKLALETILAADANSVEGNKKAAQDALKTIEAANDNAQKAVNAAGAEYQKAVEEFATAEELYKQYFSTEQESAGDVVLNEQEDAVLKLEEAKAILEEAQKQLQEAEASYKETVDSAVATAKAALEAAQKRVNELPADVTEEEKADAENAVNEAQASYNEALEKTKISIETAPAAEQAQIVTDIAVSVSTSDTDQTETSIDDTEKETIIGFAAAANNAAMKENDALTKYQAAKNALAEAQARLDALSINSEKIEEAKKAYDTAKSNMETAETKLMEAQSYVDAAENIEKWMSALASRRYTKVFAQYNKTDETYSTTNDKKFDLEDSSVVTRPEIYFIKISDGVTNGNVQIPYSLLHAYIKSIYGKNTTATTTADYDKLIVEHEAKGQGVSTGTDSTEGTMDTVYWVVDENNKITGKYYTSTEQMPEGTYFIGYTLKNEEDGYHLDGYLYSYKITTEDEPGEFTPIIIPTTPTPTTPTTRRTTTTTATPTSTAAVLGATRDMTTIADEPTALAATPEAAVLGAERNPQTGDFSNIRVWAMGLVASVILFIGWVVNERRKRKVTK